MNDAISFPATAATTCRGIAVHANGSHPGGWTVDRPLIDGQWPLHSTEPAAQQAYLAQLEVLIAVAFRRVAGIRRLTIIDIRVITDYTLVSGNRVVFTTAEAGPALRALIGQPSPVRWKQGEGWPVKLVDITTAVSVGAAAEANTAEQAA